MKSIHVSMDNMKAVMGKKNATNILVQALNFALEGEMKGMLQAKLFDMALYEK